MSQDFSKKSVIEDYKISYQSRQLSLIGRREVLGGKAKFGIFGDGKEVAQVAMVHSMKAGDWRSGYYRDQTMMLAAGLTTLEQQFAQLYADPFHDVATSGRQMNAHFATRFIDTDGTWLSQRNQINSAADLSPTAAQMIKALGLAYASKIYKAKQTQNNFTHSGTEVTFATIGNASTSEGVFWETVNAAGVLQVPLVVSVWDDAYGISVYQDKQTTKGSISEVLSGFKNTKDKHDGYRIFTVQGHDYAGLRSVYEEAAEWSRKHHNPCLVHVIELTQPQGHSTSGSHERYKSNARLEWEKEWDALRQMRFWILNKGYSTEAALEKKEKIWLEEVEKAREYSWERFQEPVQKKCDFAKDLLQKTAKDCDVDCHDLLNRLNTPSVGIKNTIQVLRQASWRMENDDLQSFLQELQESYQNIYSLHLCTEHKSSPLLVEHIPARLSDQKVDGREILVQYFDGLLKKDERVFVLGEDVGQLGGVNLEFEGLQEKHGDLRVSDTGIREATILGQGFGASMRGLKPIVDIQYLDYLLYCLQSLSDDVATLHYRTAGRQSAPVIVRTKGHRLEGVWHTGSPLGMILHALRGMHVCVPRNMTQAAGFYQTLFQGDDPALVIEVLNGYRVKEHMPENLGEYTVPLGQCEVLTNGDDLTLVTYGACVRIALEASQILKVQGISVEVVDVQCLLPFDLDHRIVHSIQKTSRLLILDEDVPGGASAYMLQKILEEQGGFDYLDEPVKTLTGQAHRSAYGSDGDYFCKPNVEDVCEAAASMLRANG
ncbi:MAG: thiamine pyrophosphate-dependent enzyme [Oligoflexales bacterium]